MKLYNYSLSVYMILIPVGEVPLFGQDNLVNAEHELRVVAQMGHPSAGNIGIAITRDGKQIASCQGSDRVARLWDLSTNTEVCQLCGHEGPVHSVLFSRDGKWLVSAGGDKTARIWEVSTGKQSRVFHHSEKITGVALSDNSRLLVTVTGFQYEKNVLLHIWDMITGTRLKVITIGGGSWITSIALSSDGRWLVTGQRDSTACLWEARTGKPVRVFRGHIDEVWSVALSADDKYLVTGSLDKTARLWDLETGKELRRFEGHTSQIHRVCLSYDGKWLVTGAGGAPISGTRDFTTRVWDVHTGQQIKVFEREAPVSCVAVSGDGKILASGTTDGIRVWNTITMRVIFTSQRNVDRLAMLYGNGKWVITSCQNDLDKLDAHCHFWNLELGKREPLFWTSTKRSEVIEVSKDGNRLLTKNDGIFHVWDLSNQKLIGKLEKNDDGFASLSFDGKILFSNSGRTLNIFGVAEGNLLRSFPAVFMHPKAISGDGKWIIEVDQTESKLRLWEVDTGREVRSFAQDELIGSGVLSPDGKWLVTQNDGRDLSEKRHSPRLWDTKTGESAFSFEGHRDVVTYLNMTNDGKVLMTSGKDQTARLWEIATRKEICVLRGHSDTVTSVMVSTDGRRVFTSSLDQTARVWDRGTGKELCRMISFLDGTWAVIDYEGRYDSANNGSIKSLQWVASNEPLIADQVRDRFYDPGLLAKHIGYNQKPLRNLVGQRNIKLYPSVEAKLPAAGKDKVTLYLSNRGGGIGKVQVFVNGKERISDARGAGFEQTAEHATLQVELAAIVRPGHTNHISVVTWNLEGSLSSNGLKLEWTPK